MMHPKSTAAAALLILILAVILVLINPDFGHPGISPAPIRPTENPNAQVENARVQNKTSSSISAARIPAVSQVVPPQDNPSIDGPSLLQNHCAQCHLVKLLEQSKKSRDDWEKTLSRMEEIGVRLSDAERSVLLDHLAVPN